MKKEKVTGVLVKSLTPYDNSGNIDLEAFARYISFVTEEGAYAILVPSVLGGSDQLSFEEKEKLVSCAVKTAGEKTMIIA